MYWLFWGVGRLFCLWVWVSHIFVGLLLEFRVWFWWFHTFQAVSQSFLIKSDIHLSTVVLAPIDWRWRFCILDQLDYVSPMSSWSHLMFYWFSNSLATRKCIEVGGVGNWPLRNAEIPCRVAVGSWGADLLRSPHLWRTFCSLSHVSYPFGHWNTWVVLFDSWPYPFVNFHRSRRLVFSWYFLLVIVVIPF